jgi:hypothetical protein
MRGVTLALGLMLAVAGAGSAAAQGICACCEGEATAACKPACAAAQDDAGFCRPAMIFSGDAGTPAGVNPLVSPSLKYLSLPKGSPGELESARQLLEQWRRRAEARFGVAKQRYLAGEITRADYDAQRAALEASLVNYQHGMRAYRAALSQTAGN